MKYLFIFLLYATALGATDVKALFITQDNKPTKGLIELLTIDGLYDPEDTLAAIQEKTQKQWIGVVQGKNNLERCDLKDTREQAALRSQVVKAANEMGIFSANTPSKKHYTYAIVLGGFRDGVKFRLQELISAWQEGIRFDKLFFLTGERKLRVDKDGNLSGCETEYDMCKVIWETQDAPEDMKETLDGNVFFVNAPRGEHARPGTQELYQTWIKEYKPDPGTILASSHPLYWTHQQLAAMSVLGTNYQIETIAPAVTSTQFEHNLISVVHDTVAKCLYELSRTEWQLG